MSSWKTRNIEQRCYQQPRNETSYWSIFENGELMKWCVLFSLNHISFKCISWLNFNTWILHKKKLNNKPKKKKYFIYHWFKNVVVYSTFMVGDLSNEPWKNQFALVLFLNKTFYLASTSCVFLSLERRIGQGFLVRPK